MEGTTNTEVKVIRAFRRHISTNLVGYLALFLALGGTSYATVKLGKGSVRSVNIAKKSIQPRHLAKATVKKFRSKEGERGSAGPEGPVGAKGDQGSGGPAGTQGAVATATSGGLSDLFRARSFSAINSSSTKEQNAHCPTGKRVVSGGASITSAAAGVVPVAIKTSEPTASDPAQPLVLDGWRIVAYETEAFAENWQLEASAICVKVN